MRLAFISVSDQAGGSEVMLLQVAAELRRVRPAWELHLIVPGSGPLFALWQAAGMRATALPMPPSLSRLGEWGLQGAARGAAGLRLVRAALDLPAYERQLRETLAGIAPDVVHSNGFKAHILAARAPHPHRALIWHMHEYLSARPLTRTLIRRYARRCDVMVANSQSVADDLRIVDGKSSRIVVVHNAVDLERFTPRGASIDLDARSGLPPAPPGCVRVGLVATFSRWKGHDTYLRALAALPDTPAVRGYVVGGALYDTDRSQYTLDELKALAAAHGLGTRVGFTGFVMPADAVMRALDIVVHASTTPEPFGLVIAEAMAAGRAVITSGTGGAAELVRDGVDAMTHAAGDHASLAARIHLLASDSALRAALGSAARATAERRFDARRLGPAFADVYESAVDKVVAHG